MWEKVVWNGHDSYMTYLTPLEMKKIYYLILYNNGIEYNQDNSKGINKAQFIDFLCMKGLKYPGQYTKFTRELVCALQADGFNRKVDLKQSLGLGLI